MTRIALFVLICSAAPAQQVSVTVDATPGHATNTMSPLRALGSAVDGVPTGTVDEVYTPPNIQQMLSAGYGPLTYRLYTELSVQDWHWNPHGYFSGPDFTGYWTGYASPNGTISHSHGYNLPRRGSTTDQGNNSSYSRLDDGDSSTFWKSQPYLTSAFTNESDALHPQWFVADLGSAHFVNAIELQWGDPYATDYLVQYWSDSGEWVTFPYGTVTTGRGGDRIRYLGTVLQPIKIVRVWMTASSGTCVPGSMGDLRDCVGYSIREVGIGSVDDQGNFTDELTHRANQSQSLMYVSSTDPWHTANDIEAGEEQPGLDLVYSSGITRGIPPVLPVTMLYGTPEDSVNQIAYLKAKGDPIGYVELGEEPDGQYILPEDYGALYVQWAQALHHLDPKLKLGGPVLSGDQEVYTWPDASGNTSWLNRFFNYLKSHGAINDLAFMSYEHYPYEPCTITWNDLLSEPNFTYNSLKTWKNDGLPAGVPVFVTESNVTYDYQESQVGLFGALWFSDFAGVFLTLGGNQVYFYEYEPLPLFSSSSCNSWGNFGMFHATNKSQVLGYTSQYFAAQMLTQRWAEPIDAAHYVYRAETDKKTPSGASIVTAYSLLRPDGQWSVLLINKDASQSYDLHIAFHDAASGTDRHYSGPVSRSKFSSAEYIWHANNAFGFPSPDGPIALSSVTADPNTVFTIPAASMMVLSGGIH